MQAKIIKGQPRGPPYQFTSSGRTGRAAISILPISAWASSACLADDATGIRLAVVDLARLLGKPLADILGVGLALRRLP